MSTTKTLRDFQKQSKIGLIYNCKVLGLHGTFPTKIGRQFALNLLAQMKELHDLTNFRF